MIRGRSSEFFRISAGVCAAALAFGSEPVLPGTQPLTLDGDLSAQMVDGIHRFLDAETAASVQRREQWWHADFSSPEAYEKSVAPNRARLAQMLGIVDPRVSTPSMQLVATTSSPAIVAETDRFIAYAVRWPVLDGVCGEGLLLQPKSAVSARVVALPDAGQTPEMIAGLAAGVPAAGQYARRLAENGCTVVVPTLLDRSDAFSGNPRLGRTTNQPHREWIYRQAYEMGRHVIGYEIQKVQSAIDWFVAEDRGAKTPMAVVGWGEGGLIALGAGAVDVRIDATVVSGYFGPREQLWQEPIYRNVFGLLREFGDAGLARLVVPRTLIVEESAAPAVSGPPAPRPRFAGAAPGRIASPSTQEVRAEVERARRLAGRFGSAVESLAGGPLAEPTLRRLLAVLSGGAGRELIAPGAELRDARTGFSAGERQQRQLRELEAFTQRQLALSAGGREEFFWKKTPATTVAAWRQAMGPRREQFWSEVIGRLETGAVPPNPRTRRFVEQPKWTGYEVVLDVLPDVFAWGYLLLPTDLKPGERRPVVVVQHGLEGLPADTITEDPKSRAYGFYKAFGVRLAERGFIVFAPHNPYRGEDRFRRLQRKANPLGQSLFSFIIAQHQVLLDWLATQPNVDPQRMGFYGLSYGGKTAMRVPAVLERYALSICSGDFNEWVWKNATTDWTGSYLFTKEWEMPEFNLGRTFNYAEMAALIAPRPFMVERGHDDGVGLDEYVAFEYAKVKRLYDRLGIPERTALEYFVGPHTIHGVGTFEFLHRQLGWPEPK